MIRSVVCACGATSLRVRLDATQCVGLVTCTGGHTSLLLDSRDHWHEVIQDGRPKEARCKCGSRAFAMALDYALREDGDVRTIEVTLRCDACGLEKHGATFDIDYSPTDTLVSMPLDPIDDPWRKAKHLSFTGLWRPSDAVEVVRRLVEVEHTTAYLEQWNALPRVSTLDELRHAIEAENGYMELAFALGTLSVPDDLRDFWKRAPIVRIGSPTSIRYDTGVGTLYELEWAEQVFDEGVVVAQPAELLALGRRLQTWLSSRFVSTRGKKTYDEPTEFARLVGGW